MVAIGAGGMASGGSTGLGYTQSIAGYLDSAIGAHGLTQAELSRWLAKAEAALDRLRQEHADGSLPLLRIVDETADIEAAKAAYAKLAEGAETVVFYGTGGSGLGGQTLAQLGGWNIPTGRAAPDRTRPRTRFVDNLDPNTLGLALARTDFATTRFIVTSKSGGTAETLAQAIATLAAVKAAGLGDRISDLFLGITEPAKPGVANGLRALLAAHGIPMLEHHTGIGGRFSGLTNVGLMAAIARGLDAGAIRAGAADVVGLLLQGGDASSFAPAVGAAASVALSKERGIRTLVMMPYVDRLLKFGAWYVQLWAESLGKGGEGTSPIAALGPVDQHSQLQLFMDGPREIAVSVVRLASAGSGPVLDPELASLAGASFMAGRSIGDIVHAQAHAVPEALARAGRPVRTFDLSVLDERTMGQLLMHFMLETIIAGRLLNLDPFDQPAVELAKVLTREKLGRSAA